MTGQKFTVSFLTPGVDMSLPRRYQWRRGDNTEKHIWAHKGAKIPKQKAEQHARLLWQLIKSTCSKRRCYYKLC